MTILARLVIYSYLLTKMNSITLNLIFIAIILHAYDSCHSLKINRAKSNQDEKALEEKFKKFLETRPKFSDVNRKYTGYTVYHP